MIYMTVYVYMWNPKWSAISGGSLLSPSYDPRYAMGISSSRGRTCYELLALFYA